MTTRLSTHPTARRRLVAAAGAVLLVGSLAACGGGSDSGEAASLDAAAGSSSVGGELEDKAAAPETSDDGSAPDGGRPAMRPVARTAAPARRPGCCPATGRDLPRVDHGARHRRGPGGRPRRGAGPRRRRGRVLGADLHRPGHPRLGQATLTLRVPPRRSARRWRPLGRLGKELDRQRSAEDVTTQVADVDSRVARSSAASTGSGVLLSRGRDDRRGRAGRGRAGPAGGRPRVAAGAARPAQGRHRPGHHRGHPGRAGPRRAPDGRRGPRLPGRAARRLGRLRRHHAGRPDRARCAAAVRCRAAGWSAYRCC